MSNAGGLDAVSAVFGGQGNNVFLVNLSKQNMGLHSILPWSIDEVYNILVDKGVNKEDAATLHREDVDGECLPSLNDENLSKMKIPTFGRRNKILRVVNQIIMDAMGDTEGIMDNVNVNHHRRSSQSPHSKHYNKSHNSGYSSNFNYNNERERERERTGPGPLSPSRAPIIQNPKNSTSPRSRSHSRPGSSRPNAEYIDYAQTDYDTKPTMDYDSDVDGDRHYVHPRQSRLARFQAQSNRSRNGQGLRSSGAPDDDDDLFAEGTATATAEFMAVKPWLGAIVPPTNPPRNNPHEPDRHLRLDWVYGYKSFDSRSNCVYNAIGDVIYPVAGVVVVYKAKQRIQKHFLGHDDDVRCLAQHPSNHNLVATGQNSTIVDGKGAPPHVCVWDTTDFGKVWRLNFTQADRAIRSLSFSADGRYLVTVSDDDAYTIKVWDWEKRSMITAAKGDRNPIYQVRCNHKDNSEFVTVGKRHASFWSWDGKKLASRRAQLGNDRESHSNTFYCAAFSEKGYACLGSEDGAVYVFQSGKLAKVFKGIHEGKVLTLDWYPGGLVSGGSDKQVCILDRKMDVARSFSFTHKIISVYIRGSNLLVGTGGSEVFEIINFPDTDIQDDSKLEAVTTGHFDGELWALCAAPDGKHVVTAGEDNTVCIWDLTNHRLVKRGIINEKSGRIQKVRRAATTSLHAPNQCARAIAVSPNGKHIIIGSNDGWVHVMNSANLSKLVSVDLNKYGKRQVTNQSENWIQVIAYSPSGHTVAVGTHGSIIALLDVQDGYKVKGVIKSHNSYLTHIDWSEDGTYIQSNCGAYELLFHSIDENDLRHTAQVTNASSIRDVKWFTQTCTFGWSVQGIFDPLQDGSDVNTVDLNSSNTLVATGDDRGKVNLYRYPALKGNKFISYDGHSSHVPSVRFTPDDKWLTSVGGHDLALMQWAII